MIYPKFPKLIERLINLILENVGVRSDMREWYFAFFRLLLSCILDSNPTVNSRIYREEPVTSTRSGLRESLVIMLGDRNEGRSAYNEYLANDERSLLDRKGLNCDIRCFCPIQGRLHN